MKKNSVSEHMKVLGKLANELTLIVNGRSGFGKVDKLTLKHIRDELNSFLGKELTHGQSRGKMLKRKRDDVEGD